MIGAIIGDIVGSTYEFHNTQNYDFELFLRAALSRMIPSAP